MSDNTMFPGRPDYIGPTTGIFGLLHHDVLCELSHDVMERVAYVKREKLAHEVAVRLHNMIYLGDCEAAVKYYPLVVDHFGWREVLYADYLAKCDTTIAVARAARDYYQVKCSALQDAYRPKTMIVAYILTHIPDCAWNGKRLTFDKIA